MMNTNFNKRVAGLHGENGFILIVTMLILVVLTILCIGALDMSTFEMRIAGNDRQGRVAFNLADGGVYAAGKLIGETITLTADPDYTPTLGANGLMFINIPPSCVDNSPTTNVADVFHGRVLGFTTERDVVLDGPYDYMLNVPNDPTSTLFGRIADRDSETMAGGGAEFATGAAGVGTGSAGGVAITFDIDIDACAAGNANAQLAVRYRKVLGAAGGL